MWILVKYSEGTWKSKKAKKGVSLQVSKEGLQHMSLHQTIIRSLFMLVHTMKINTMVLPTHSHQRGAGYIITRISANSQLPTNQIDFIELH